MEEGPKNQDIAEHFFNIASDQGSDLANFNLAVIFGQRQHDEASTLLLTLFFMAALWRKGGQTQIKTTK